VQGTAIVERGILEDQPTKVTVRGNDVVGLLAQTCSRSFGSRSLVSRTKEDVTSEPCMALNSEPPNTPATRVGGMVHQDVVLLLGTPT